MSIGQTIGKSSCGEVLFWHVGFYPSFVWVNDGKYPYHHFLESPPFLLHFKSKLAHAVDTHYVPWDEIFIFWR